MGNAGGGVNRGERGEVHVRGGLGRVEVEENVEKVNKKEESVIWVWRDVPGIMSIYFSCIRRICTNFLEPMLAVHCCLLL